MTPTRTPVTASARGVEVSDVLVTDTIDAQTGEPGAARDVFTAGTAVHVWIEFTYDGGSDDGLIVSWFRGDERVSSSTFRLPQPTAHVVATLGAGETAAPGDYRVEVTVGLPADADELVTLPFEVN